MGVGVIARLEVGQNEMDRFAFDHQKRLVAGETPLAIRNITTLEVKLENCGGESSDASSQ
jgi:hypothetical protein